MPVYDYTCNNCQRSFAVTAKMSDPKPLRGPDCKERICQLERKFTAVACIGGSKGESKTEELAPSPAAAKHRCSNHCDH